MIRCQGKRWGGIPETSFDRLFSMALQPAELRGLDAAAKIQCLSAQ
jgi:hypothetical protein